MVDLTQIKQDNDLVAIAEQAGAKFNKSMSSACPLHHGDNPTAFHVFDGDDGFQHFKCFTHEECNRNGSDVIAFTQTRFNCDFKTALMMLGGSPRDAEYQEMVKKTEQKPQPRLIELPDADWQRDAWNRVLQAQEALRDEKQGRAGRSYLEGRKITPASMEEWFLGYDPAKFDVVTQLNRPAIVIPWIDADREISAVKYRFIDELANDPKKRWGALGGSKQILFGLHNVKAGHQTLIFTEGELNAISVRQVAPKGVCVVSAGGQGNANPDVLHVLAARFWRVVIWMDEEKNAEDVHRKMGVYAARVVNNRNGEKTDANDLLKSGSLSGMVELMLSSGWLSYTLPPYEDMDDYTQVQARLRSKRKAVRKKMATVGG